ncbi:hypothetical protein [Oleiharenicola lentus]|uniref:hypothetical protein n=1 Tax=Oleiharenicola lentus TaxID=2508720 RepID=UPI003F664387
MKATHTAALLALVSSALLVWLLPETPATAPATPPPANPVSHPSKNTADSATQTLAALKTYYRREQIKAELAIEQRRYGANYWETELGAKALHALQAERLARLNELNAEMSGVWREMSFASAETTSALTPLFSPESAGPNVSFLSLASREKVETLIVAAAQRGPIKPADLIDQLRTLLPADEFADYVKWNAPAAALRRMQLVGFHASEKEFNTLAQHPDFVNPTSGQSTEPALSASELEILIGAARFAELNQLRTAERQTAVHDLHRLGLPLDYAKWLQDFRAQAVTTLQAVWQEPHTPDAAKAARVDQLQHAYRLSLLATLSPTGAAFDETELLP